MGKIICKLFNVFISNLTVSIKGSGRTMPVLSISVSPVPVTVLGTQRVLNKYIDRISAGHFYHSLAARRQSLVPLCSSLRLSILYVSKNKFYLSTLPLGGRRTLGATAFSFPIEGF